MPPMPNLRDLQQLAGVIVAVIAIIVGIVLGIKNDSPENESLPPSPSPIAQTKTVFLADLPNSGRPGNILADDFTATFNGTQYPKSIIAAMNNYSGATAVYENLGRYARLEANVAFDSTVKPDGHLSKPEERHGRVTVIVDGLVVEQIVVGQGEIKPLHVNLSNMRRSLVIEFEAGYYATDNFSHTKVYDGLALLTPTLHR